MTLRRRSVTAKVGSSVQSNGNQEPGAIKASGVHNELGDSNESVQSLGSPLDEDTRLDEGPGTLGEQEVSGMEEAKTKSPTSWSASIFKHLISYRSKLDEAISVVLPSLKRSPKKLAPFVFSLVALYLLLVIFVHVCLANGVGFIRYSSAMLCDRPLAVLLPAQSCATPNDSFTHPVPDFTGLYAKYEVLLKRSFDSRNHEDIILDFDREVRTIGHKFDAFNLSAEVKTALNRDLIRFHNLIDQAKQLLVTLQTLISNTALDVLLHQKHSSKALRKFEQIKIDAEAQKPSVLSGAVTQVASGLIESGWIPVPQAYQTWSKTPSSLKHEYSAAENLQRHIESISRRLQSNIKTAGMIKGICTNLITLTATVLEDFTMDKKFVIRDNPHTAKSRGFITLLNDLLSITVTDSSSTTNKLSPLKNMIPAFKSMANFYQEDINLLQQLLLEDQAMYTWLVGRKEGVARIMEGGDEHTDRPVSVIDDLQTFMGRQEKSVVALQRAYDECAKAK